MLNWKKIEELNLKEVASKTQIELDFLEALIKKDFATLNRFNVRGFIKILSREYDFDFTDFNEEFQNYLDENNINNTKPKMITPKLDSYSQKSTSMWPFMIIIVILIIAGGGIYYFDNIKTLFKSEQNSSSTMVIDIIGQAQSNLKNLESNVVVINNQEKNISQEEPKQEPEKILDKNETKIDSDENTSKQDDFKDENISTETNQSSPIAIKEQSFVLKELNKDAYFKVSGKIWVGIIDLQNYKKTSFVKEKDFNISLNTNQLILTGAAALSVLDENGKEHKFPAGNSKRFLIKDGKITNISVTEFMKLNKGKEW